MKKPVFKHKLFKYVLVDLYTDKVHGKAKLTFKEAACKNEGYAMNGASIRYQKV